MLSFGLGFIFLLYSSLSFCVSLSLCPPPTLSMFWLILCTYRHAKITAKSLLDLEFSTDLDLEKSTDDEPSFRIDTGNPVQLFRFVGSGTEATKEEAFIAYKSSLEDLALSRPPKKCMHCRKVVKDMKTTQKGSALHIQWVWMNIIFKVNVISNKLLVYTHFFIRTPFQKQRLKKKLLPELN